MRIGYIVARFPKASETFVSREILALKRRGIEVEVFALSAPDAAERARLSRDVQELIEHVHYIDVPAMLRAVPFAAMQLEASELNEALSSKVRGRPALRLLRAAAIALKARELGLTRIHAHWPLATQLAMLVHAMIRLPISASVHAHEVAHENGHFELAFERLEFASFCNQAAMEKLLAALPRGSRPRCHLLYHGVDLARFPEQPWPREGRSLHVFSAGRLTPTKGFDRLIRAVARAREQGSDVRLSICGEGPERPRLEGLARELGVTDHVALPGWVPHDRMAELLSGVHVFALLADCNFHDGLPNVALEAMASGRPVILSPLPAAAEAVEHGVSGHILPAPDAIDECARLFGELLHDPGGLEAAGQAARRRVEAAFDETRSLDALVGLFESSTSVHPEEARREAGVPTLSVVTIAKNEEKDLPNFLASFLPWVDEIVICDDGSTDRTEEIARAAGPKIKFLRAPRRTGEGFHSQRNKAIELATGDWLLHVDVDMRLTPEFARELRAAIERSDKDVYSYRRANYFLNVPAFHAMNGAIRYRWLTRRGLGTFVSPIHERLELSVPEERCGELRGRLHHLGDDIFEERLRKNVQYALLERERTRAAGRRTTLRDVLARPAFYAARSYTYGRGFLDGRMGAFWALYQVSSNLNRFLLEYADSIRREREDVDGLLLGEMPASTPAQGSTVPLSVEDRR